MPATEQETRKYYEILKLYEIQVDERLPKAKEGDRHMGTSLLAIAAGLLKAELPLPPKLAEWLSLGLSGLAAGMTTEESFGIRPRGKGRTTKNAVKIRQERFTRAFLSEYLHQTENIPLERAFERVAEIANVSTETVNAAWDECHEQVKMTLAVSLGQVYKVRQDK